MRFSQFPCFLLVATFFIFSLACMIPVVHTSQCLADQKTLLLQLKSSLEFNSALSNKLVLWDPNTDCCKWAGATCDDAGRVIGLDLSNESISGGLIHNSTSLFGLRYLQSLNLASNDFNYTHIPSGFEKLTSLTYLNLSHTNFAGEIPIGISRLTRLVSLDFSHDFSNNVPLISNLKLLIQNFTELSELRLDSVNISPKEEEWCEAISYSLPNLRVLNLYDSHLSGPLCFSLENLQSLSVINLSWNNFSGPIPNSMASLPQLVHLNLGWNKLTGPIPSFSMSKNLTYMNLSQNSLSGAILSSHFEGLSNLEEIDLSFNSLNGSIPSSLFELPSLMKIQLSNNRFDGEVEEFSNASSFLLESIDLSFNSLNGSIPSSLFELSSLKMIQLSNNRFDGEVEEFSNASSSLLESIDLRRNNLQGPIPMPFFELPRLSRLLLSSNNFSGLVQLETVYKLSNLTILDLSYNRLSIATCGTSSSLSSIPMFQALRLVSCNLQCFPDLRNQPRLQYLDLSDNQIDGNIPNWIWEVGNGDLFHLNLSHNLVSGFQEPYLIPTTTLEILDLHSNQLRGEIPIPSSFTTYVDLSSNNFSSSIPANIGSSIPCFVLFFSLSNNSVIGNIPQSICNMRWLLLLDLSNNRLSGPIPSCLITRSASTLRVLNLRNNKLSGNVLSSFPSDCNLQSLDLSVNHLEGQVPKSLVNCREIEVLNLGKNKISDRFPCFLKNISSLRVLILRSNRFQGDISCQGGNINDSWPNLQIIDLAVNNFGGVLPSNFFSNWKTMMIDQDNVQPVVRNLGPTSNFFSNWNAMVIDEDNAVRSLGFPSFIQPESYTFHVTLIYKKNEVELVKVLTIFTLIDFSSNRFEGQIPSILGNLKSLALLNLSHNALTGSIPTSLGNLKQFEALDLSQNMLSGMIPTQLASLTFLSVFNVSYNLLVGRIPTGSQFQTFTEMSYLGNKGLCGFPLNKSCNITDVPQDSPPPMSHGGHPLFETQVYLSAALGFIVGLGIIIWPLVFVRRWRQWYYKHVDRLFLRRIQTRAYRNPIRRL